VATGRLKDTFLAKMAKNENLENRDLLRILLLDNEKAVTTGARSRKILDKSLFLC